jgi:phage/plasmid-like protein (TIGR03299 family)
MRSTENVAYTNITEAISAFNLDFTVAKAPLFASINGENVPTEKVATYRTDTNNVLGIVGKGYEIVQNINQFDAFETFAEKGLVSFENGGVFSGGSKTYIQCVLPSTIEIGNSGDITKKYITICSSHDGSIALQCFISSVRIWCSNTFNLAIKTGSLKTRIKHTKTANIKMVEAITMIDKSLEAYNVYDEFLMASSRTKEYNDSEVKKFVDLVIPSTSVEKDSTRKLNQRNELLENIYNGIGQREIKQNTLYKLFQGVTGYSNNIVGEKKKDKMEFLTLGTGYDFNAQGYEVAKRVLQNDLILS